MKTCLFLLIELDFIEKDDIIVEEINVKDIIEKNKLLNLEKIQIHLESIHELSYHVGFN